MDIHIYDQSNNFHINRGSHEQNSIPGSGVRSPTLCIIMYYFHYPQYFLYPCMSLWDPDYSYYPYYLYYPYHPYYPYYPFCFSLGILVPPLDFVAGRLEPKWARLFLFVK